MKYNKREIMKAAWSLYNTSKMWVNSLSFAECLRRAWANAKEAIANAKRLDSGDCLKNINGVILGIRRTIVDDRTMGWAVTGKTYAARKALKAAGFEYDGEARSWYTTDRQVAEYFC